MTAESSNDAETIRRILGGEVDLYRVLVERYRRDLQLRANRILPRRTDCDDAVQETFVRAYFRLKDFKPDANFRAWLFGILRHVVGDAYRRNRRNRETALAEETLTTLEAVADRQPTAERNASLSEWLELCMKTLEKKARNLILMRYAKGMTGKSIGQALAMSEFAVNVAAMRVRVALKQCIETRSGTAS